MRPDSGEWITSPNCSGHEIGKGSVLRLGILWKNRHSGSTSRVFIGFWKKSAFFVEIENQPVPGRGLVGVQGFQLPPASSRDATACGAFLLPTAPNDS
jgi:hypothetical protein